MCLKQSFPHSNRVLQAILSLTGHQTVFSGSCSKFYTAFLPDCTKSCSVFFGYLDSQFSGDSKNVLKTVIFLLQVVNADGLYLTFQTVFSNGCFGKFGTAFLLDCTNRIMFFLFRLLEGNLIRIPKICLEQ